LQKVKLLKNDNTSETSDLKDIKTYEDYAVDFVFDYDRENPMTETEAKEAWI
jgi:hypothetical protein